METCLFGKHMFSVSHRCQSYWLYLVSLLPFCGVEIKYVQYDMRKLIFYIQNTLINAVYVSYNYTHFGSYAVSVKTEKEERL